MTRRLGTVNQFYVLLLFAAVMLTGVGIFLFSRNNLKPTVAQAKGDSTEDLLLFCAAGMRYPIELIVADYKKECGVTIQVDYGGSNTLLSRIEVAKQGDLYLAADESYLEKAREKGLAEEMLALAKMRPVIAVQKDNTTIKGIDDLMGPDVRVGLGNPGAAAVGKKTKKLLTNSGHWEKLNAHVTNSGVFKPTVNEVANDVKLGSINAGIIWDSTVGQYPELKAIRTKELDAGEVDVTIGVLTSARNATAALKFARYVAARDRGLKRFAEKGFEVVDGDLWAATPEITLYAGAVNRRALEPIIEIFERREGVQVNTVYNGCGILTAQMRELTTSQDGGFPDVYMACDVYYLEAVQELFGQGVHVSEADVVIAVEKGNPKGLKTLDDLIKPGMRVAIGQPQQCTIGVLTRRLLEDAGIYKKLFDQKNIVTETATSALLVPAIATGSADAALVYVTDTLAESDKIDVIRIDSPLARAVQPFSIAKSSKHQHLGRRLFETVSRSKDHFVTAGFTWILGGPKATVKPPQGEKDSSTAPAGGA